MSQRRVHFAFLFRAGRSRQQLPHFFVFHLLIVFTYVVAVVRLHQVSVLGQGSRGRMYSTALELQHFVLANKHHVEAW